MEAPHLLDTALRYHRAGLTVLPNDPAKKYPADLREWQTVMPTEQMIRSWYQRPGRAIGLRDVEGLDFDNKGYPNAETLYSDWYTLCDALAPGLPAKLLLEQTPSGGYHVAWRCEIISGNQKLATRPPTTEERQQNTRLTFVTLIETRGKGGQFQVAPSPGYILLRGDWTALPIITPAERQIILDSARALSQTDSRTMQSLQVAGERPGDKYNAEHADEARRILEQAGWRVMYQRGDALYLCRPGKNHGISATFGYVAPGVLYVFSSSAAPFEPGRAYSPFAVYTELVHNGNYKAAAAALRGVDAKTGEIIERKDAPPAKPVGKVEYVLDFRQYGISAAELQTLEFAPLKWIADGILPEGATLLAGKPKSKKSWLALAAAVAVAMGGKVLGYYDVLPGTVLYLDLESNQRRMKSRLGALLGAIRWPKHLHIYTKWERGEAGIALLDAWMEAHPDTSLVVIDILQNFRPPKDPKADPYQQDYEAVKMINEFAERHRIAVIVIHHTRKAKADDVFDEISGTTGLSGGVASMWVLGRSPDNTDESILAIRGRDISDDDPMALKWDTYTCQFVRVATGAEVSSSGERRAILEAMAIDMEYQLKEIAAAIGKTVSATSNLMRRLMDDNLIHRIGNGRYAKVPQKVPYLRESRESGESRESDESRERVEGEDFHDFHALSQGGCESATPQQDAVESPSDDHFHDFHTDLGGESYGYSVERVNDTCWRVIDNTNGATVQEFDNESAANAACWELLQGLEE